jgi:hypothetical protein
MSRTLAAGRRAGPARRAKALVRGVCAASAVTSCHHDVITWSIRAIVVVALAVCPSTGDRTRRWRDVANIGDAWLPWLSRASFEKRPRVEGDPHAGDALVLDVAPVHDGDRLSALREKFEPRQCVVAFGDHAHDADAVEPLGERRQ